MSVPRRTFAVSLAGAALVAVVVGVTYLVVACQSLPGLLGPVAGDTQPRTKLGLAFLVLGALLAAGGMVATRRQRGASGAGN